MLLNIGFIRHQQDIDDILTQLDKIEIIGENPIKYWEKDTVSCKLDIINPEYIVRTATIEAMNQEMEEFKMHIMELLNLRVIQRS